MTIGGRKVVTLSQPRVINPHNPQFLSAQILPGRGMNIFQIKAHLPVQGEISLIESPPVEEAARLMNGGPEDAYFSQSFSMGGAILAPFANRIRGKLSSDRKTLETKILDKTVRLDANWSGKKPGAEPHAMHGLILGSPMDKVTLDTSPNEASVTGSLDAGDFGGHWLSKTALTIKATLHINAFRLDVTAQNTGTEDLPIGIGWHPYFVLPSGDREQARLRIPARQRALVNNYDDVFPTGELVAVGDTSYDFNMPGGARLGKMFLDDCFVDLQRNTEGHATADIIDPKGGYGLRIRALSPEISAFQAYAPPDKKFVAFEPQFNWADPYSKIWQGKDTGMKVLKPGESVTYSVQLELYVP
ncbi:MAG TPA: aldose 1-epimerase [Bryobacteraceae bacterium]|nr:aldose 1-epimerase [Bryobacteraceae bacterium]